MIKELLTYQAKDKERLAVLAGVDGGKVKRELDACNRGIAESKQALLGLENDAKILVGMFESASKNLGEIFDRISQFNKSMESDKTEDELASAHSYVSALLARVNGYESQLEDVSRKIASKTAQFEDGKASLQNASKRVGLLQAEYEKQRKEIEPKLTEFERELKKLESSVDKVLLEKYAKARRNDKSGKVVDVVVPLSSNRCGGCYFEMPLSQVHSISTNGYITCEECGKIIFKN
jgi:predicted  nucleic acid-binding Zn-ribbon protein